MQHFFIRKTFVISNYLYRILLFAYPKAYRFEYGTQMEQLFRDLCRDSYRRKGIIGLVQLWGRVLLDTVLAALVEHTENLQNGGHMLSRIISRLQYRNLLLLTGLPILLGLVLFLINSAFMEKLYMPNSSQPIGWLMAAVVFILTGTAYLFQLRIIKMSRTTESTGEFTTGSVLLFFLKRKELFFLFNILFFIVPAMFLILFGPAILMLLQTGP